MNGFLLLVVLFYVYPLKFLAGGLVSRFLPQSQSGFVLSGLGEFGQVLALYGAGFVGVFLSFALMYRHVSRSAEKLALNPFAAAEARSLFRHYLIFVGVGLMSIWLALLNVGVAIAFPGWVYVILGPLCWAHGEWSERELGPLRAARDT